MVENKGIKKGIQQTEDTEHAEFVPDNLRQAQPKADRLAAVRCFFARKYSFAFASFAVSVLLLLLLYAFGKASPFGDRQIFRIDQYHQYAPFLQSLRDKILSGSSLFYSWDMGGGANFWATLSYYGMSPFNLFVLLFPAEGLADAMLLITILKLGAAAACMQFFLQQTYFPFRQVIRGSLSEQAQGKPAALLPGVLRERCSYGFLTLALGVAYSLCTFVMAYSWNNMWLDALILLPLVALGTVEFMREGRFLLYIFSLALALITNFYMAGMICIFLLAYFFCAFYRFACKTSIRELIRLILYYALASVAAFLIAAVILLPAYFALKQSSAVGDQFPTNLDFIDHLVDSVGRLAVFSKPQVMSGTANLFCTSLVILLVPAFLLNQRIPRKARLSAGITALVLFASFNINYLNFLMHGMHYPNSLNHRFAFLLVFLSLALCADAIAHPDGVRRKIPCLVAAVFLLILLIIQGQDKISGESLYGAIFFLFILGLLVSDLLAPDLKSGQRSRLIFCLCLVLLIETGLNAAFCFNENAKEMPFGPKDGYAAGESIAELRKITTDIDSEQRAGTQMARVIKKPTMTINDGSLYNFRTFDVFSSMYPKATVDFFSALGYETNGINSVLYKDGNPSSDTLLGIRYYINKNDSAFRPDQHRISRMNGSYFQLHENPDAMNFAYFVTGETDIELNHDHQAIESQNRLAHELGEAENIFIEESNTRFARSESEAEALQSAQEMAQAFEKITLSKDDNFVFFNAPVAGQYALSWDVEDKHLDYVSLDSNASLTYLSNSGHCFSDIGFMQPGQKVKLNFHRKNDGTATLDLKLARLDEAQYQAMLERVHSRELQVGIIHAAAFSGSLTAPTDGRIFLSIPYDAGWKFEVNGRVVQAERAFKGMTAIRVPKGEVVLKAYFVPQGFLIGLLLSLLGIVLTLAARIASGKFSEKAS